MFKGMALKNDDTALLASIASGIARLRQCQGGTERSAPITTVDVSDNQIGARGVRALARLLKSNAFLCSLDLSGNNLVSIFLAMLARL
jgi:hypothetical protein